MKRLLIALVAAAVIGISGCGGGGATINPPPPTGNFSLASLHGTYAFTTSGRVVTNTSTGLAESPLARVGSFFADGTGHITGGVEDVNANGTVTTAILFDNTSSYTVNPDGRGTLTLNLTANGVPATINFGIVLTSGKSGSVPASDGLVIDETSTTNQASTGSGNFVLQNTGVFQTTLITGTYTFDFSGVDAGGSPESIVGEFSASSGGITGGLEDANDNFAITMGPPTGSGSFIPDPQNSTTLGSFGRGLVTIANETYAFYIVDPTRLVRLISIGNGATTPPMLTGDAVLSNIPASVSNGGFAFLVAGSSANGGLIRVARFTAAGATLSNLLMDVNDNASENQVNLSSGTISGYDPTTGRGTLSFSNSTATFAFVFYLSSQSGGVIQEQTLGGNSVPIAVADGSILAQTGGPFTSSNITGPYAMNWSGIVTSNGSQDEEDLVSQVSVTNLSLNGTSDIFQFTTTNFTPQFDVGTNGTITINGDGSGDDGKRVDMTVNLSNTRSIDMVVYVVSPQLAFFQNRDNNGAPRIVAGVLKAQQ